MTSQDYIERFRSLNRKGSNAIVLMRVGDFYETFDDDAVRFSKALGLTLTSRHGARMAGVPQHQIETYVTRAAALGLTVALIEN